MKFGGVGIGHLGSALRPEPKQSGRDLSTQAKNRAKYGQQLSKLKSTFRNTEDVPIAMGKHAKSKSPKAKVAKGFRKVKTYVAEQKQKVRNFKSKVRSAPSDSESLIGGGGSESEGGGGESVGARKKSGLRLHLIAGILGILFISAAAAFIFIPVVHVIASKYLWITFGGSSVTLVLSFTGLGASTATLLSLYVLIFKWGEIRRKTLDDWTLVICFGISALIAATTTIISTLHFHDIVEIFGEEFLELLQGYWMTPKFKTGMDTIQMEFQCCGFYSYEDWAAVETLGEYPPGFVPFSCCSIFTLRPCVHENVPRIQDVDTSEDVPLEQVLSIYPMGCKLPMENYYKTMLHWAIIVSSCLLATQAILMLLLTFSRKPSTSEY